MGNGELKMVNGEWLMADTELVEVLLNIWQSINICNWEVYGKCWENIFMPYFVFNLSDYSLMINL